MVSEEEGVWQYAFFSPSVPSSWTSTFYGGKKVISRTHKQPAGAASWASSNVFFIPRWRPEHSEKPRGTVEPLIARKFSEV